MTPETLAILVCPKTRTPLVHLSSEKLLVSTAANLAYPIQDGAPVLLTEAAIPWPQPEAKTPAQPA